ncbi:MAG: hypothetical protein A2660_00325 [Candidatus Doudnabacteria bacterium RIFCSPHIGHO2_01_FULL_45_18]|uniref:Serine protease n=1 Tax=Candidatus Doudnabacteria bacterium RIFCSPHIGHO2_01_FULL_45_18 TaxID=1817823 RepID=A0A1F5NRB0_9BACT|nr:MAG: hypothetical protein A2660_00325 [Candidatus Doudnabacteria bacterium RIFCSPHIGHO2_01_FULL_45_18]
MSRKQIIWMIVIGFFVGALGSLILGHFALPYFSTYKGLSWLSKFTSNAPIVINNSEQVYLNEGVNLIDLAKQVGNFTVSIYDAKNNFLGNGLIITADGLIFTTSSVIQKNKQLNVMTSDGKQYEASIKQSDAQSGLVIISISASNLQIGQFDKSEDLKPSHRVLYIGRGNVKFEHKVVSGYIVESLANQIGTKRIMSDAVTGSDYFGGPIVNLSGRVVGLTVNSEQNIIAENLQIVLTKYLSDSHE